MRILTIRRMLGIAAIYVAYMHGKRGGDATLVSVGDTLRHVWTSTAERLGIDKDKRASRTMPERPASPRVGAPNGLDRPSRPPGQGGH